MNKIHFRDEFGLRTINWSLTQRISNSYLTCFPKEITVKNVLKWLCPKIRKSSDKNSKTISFRCMWLLVTWSHLTAEGKENNAFYSGYVVDEYSR